MFESCSSSYPLNPPAKTRIRFLLKRGQIKLKSGRKYCTVPHTESFVIFEVSSRSFLEFLISYAPHYLSTLEFYVRCAPWAQHEGLIASYMHNKSLKKAAWPFDNNTSSTFVSCCPEYGTWNRGKTRPKHLIEQYENAPKISLSRFVSVETSHTTLVTVDAGYRDQLDGCRLAEYYEQFICRRKFESRYYFFPPSFLRPIQIQPKWIANTSHGWKKFG